MMSNNNKFLNNDKNTFYKDLFNDFGKSEIDLDKSINTLKEWAETQQHFPEKPGYNTLKFLLIFNKFSIELAKEKLDMYYGIRVLFPEYFKTNPFSSDMIFANQVLYFVPLPKPTKNNERILFHRLNSEYEDPKFFNHDKLICQYIHLIEYLLEKDLCYKFHYILDCTGVKFGHGTKLNPIAIKKATIILQRVFSNRVASFQFVNCPSVTETAANTIVKPLLHKKIQQRLTISANYKQLFEAFGKEILPKDIGGDEKSLKDLNNQLMEEYKKFKERFLELEALEVKESLRPQKLENDEILGFYGNFKKIDID